ncbi:F0F1 ATP synthase subunit gamma [Actinocrinis puniceicyclus]|uniref:ATP synthase gamma chain n=1 Tax=Actinocrinis puniceicyclus TaxID=977794 RepID=A0A8J7WRJ7_9ACTN|nr:F0F1 ATP synthase subunit gamma [Actinocrinis puniceicyclus]MBS2964889.1 F0F1 ATP synthase subunit gamma [Actinocrinis puniceicyclus]
MGAQLRDYRRRIASVSSTKKITRAQELIATARIVKAQQRVAQSTPYAREITRAVSAVASHSNAKHPLIGERPRLLRAAILLITADRGFAGAYNTGAIKQAEQLAALLAGEGKQVDRYVVGRKGAAYYRFRGVPMAGEWSGFSDNPQYGDAAAIGDALLESFEKGGENGGVDEIHVVSTLFVSMLSQSPVVARFLPLEIEETTEAPVGGVFPLYEFEPSPAEVLDALLPHYIKARLFNALLQSAASEHAARRRAMKSATDNATELIKQYTRLANGARQAEITQEISEIVGGANALADASAESQ